MALHKTIKVCGMTEAENTAACAKLGVDMLGFIFAPSSPRCTTPEFAASVTVDKRTRTVGVFTADGPGATPDGVNDVLQRGGLHMAQLSGGAVHDEAFCAAVGPHRVIKVFWPERYDTPADLQAELDRFAPVCNMFLFDAGTSGGGHGRPFDVTLLNALTPPRPWLVAGGIGPHNAGYAVTACTPHGVDVNSAVETSPGIKDPTQILACMVMMQKALKEQQG